MITLLWRPIRNASDLSPEDINYIIFTHLHWDHIGDDLLPFSKARLSFRKKNGTICLILLVT